MTMNSGYNQGDEELIDRYLDGACSGEELSLFEQRYESDPAFAEKADAMAVIRDGITGLYEEDRIRRLIEEAGTKEDRKRLWGSRLSWGLGSTMAAAASFIFFLAYSPIQIPVQVQEIRAVRNLQRSQQTDSLENEKKKVFGLFFQAQSYLAEGELQPAILKLEELTEISELRPYFKEAVHWHLVVAHLKNENPERARLYYEKLKEPVEYPIPLIDRWKAWWQLHRKQWMG